MKKLPFIPTGHSCCMVKTYRRFFVRDPIETHFRPWKTKFKKPRYYVPKQLTELEILNLIESPHGAFVDPVDGVRYRTRTLDTFNRLRRKAFPFP